MNAALGIIYGVAVTPAGEVILADGTNNRIQKLGLDGSLTTIAGDTTNGFDGDGGPGWNALLNVPYSVTLDANGNLVVADSRNNRIRLLQAQ